jgi:hypothetical protein
MATTSNTYSGNGSNKLFSVTFPYLDTADIDVFLNGTLQTVTTQYFFANATTVEFVTAPANGATVLLKRSTDDATLQATFFPGSSIKASDLNNDFDQVLFIAQETTNAANTATSTAASATTTANSALSASAAAVSTANTASTNASNAVGVANAATATANTASSNASAAVSTANSAQADATNAIATVSAASLYVIVANVAAIPTTSLTNNQGIQVTNTTGLESFTPLSGIPVGFVGNAALYARIRYSTSTSSWVWVDYAANDPETRYLGKAGGTMTGALAVTAGTAALPGIAVSGDLNTGITSPGADQLAITTGGTQRATVDSSGRLLVGTSTARGDFFNGLYASRFQLEGTDISGTMLSVTSNAATNINPNIILARSRGTNLGSSTLVASGDTLGALQFQGADGTDLVVAASIITEVDGTPGANDMPGRLVFSTTADGAASPTERMRIMSNGFILFGASATDSTGLTFGPTRSGAGSAPTLTWNGAFTGTTTVCDFLYNGARQGSITTTTSATAYNTSSDYRLKENVTNVTDGIARLQQLNPSRFNFIADPDRTVDGFIAHEVQALVPEAITGEKDAVDADGNPVYQGIDQSKLVPLLTAALQEAVAEIKALKDRVTALEGA